MTTAIAACGVHKEYPGGGGLHGVDLEVPEGAVYGLIGPNGAGKTTLLCLLAGLRHADAGEIRFGVAPERVAVCPDVAELEPWLSAREVLDTAATLTDAAIDAAQTEHLLRLVGLIEAKDRRVGGFSRGMTQRLALAATLVSDPAVIILDEPSSALDPIGRHEVLDLVARLGRDRTVLFSSHILADVQRVCDTVGVLIDGRLRYQGPIGRLLAEHIQPAWIVRVRSDAAALADRLDREGWVQHATASSDGQLRVEVTSFAAGEEHLVAALARLRARVIALEPATDDLEDAFLRLTNEPPQLIGVGPVTLLRLELLRYARTYRLIPLVAVFVTFGFGGPVLARYLPDLLGNQTSDNLTIIVSKPRPVDGISLFTSNANQLGLLVAVIVAAGVLAVDAKPGLSAFYRTRVRPFDRVVVPRYVVSATIVSLSYLLGALGAWYETIVLLGHLDPGRYVLGIGFTIVYLWFAVAIVTLTASITRSVAGTAGAAVGILLALPIAASFHPVEPWLPSTLLGAQVAMAGTDPAADFLGATLTGVAATTAAMLIALHRFRHREI
jgi:ABC-2 type transport system ATP-binding protein